MPEIAVLNESSLDDADVGFACLACDAQLREDFHPLWPDIDYSPVKFYASKKDLPVASGLSMIFTIVDEWKAEDKAAWHSFVGVPFAQIGAGFGPLSVLLSHESVELKVNPTCLAKFTLPDGAIAAREAADPVQGFTYDKTVTLFGETRQVPVSAFVTPAYFDGGPGPTFFCPGNLYELAPRAIAPGGYLPILGPGGWEPRFGYGTDRDLTAAKAANPTSRSAVRRAA